MRRALVLIIGIGMASQLPARDTTQLADESGMPAGLEACPQRTNAKAPLTDSGLTVFVQAGSIA